MCAGGGVCSTPELLAVCTCIWGGGGVWPKPCKCAGGGVRFGPKLFIWCDDVDGGGVVIVGILGWAWASGGGLLQQKFSHWNTAICTVPIISAYINVIQSTFVHNNYSSWRTMMLNYLANLFFSWLGDQLMLSRAWWAHMDNPLHIMTLTQLWILMTGIWLLINQNR